MTGRRIAWPGLSSPPALTRRTPTKRSALRLRGGRRSPLAANEFNGKAARQVTTNLFSSLHIVKKIRGDRAYSGADLSN